MSRTIVQLFGDGVEVDFGQSAEVEPAGQLLTQQAVGVLVADEWTDEAVDRVSKRPDVARRSPHYRALWKTGVMCCLLALMPVVIGLKGDMGTTSNTSGSQWLVLALVSIGLLVIGGVLLSLWWILAGRQVTSAAES